MPFKSPALKPWHYVLAGLIAYIVFLLATWPATLAHDLARDRGWLPSDLALEGLSGSVWSGGAQQLRWEALSLQGLAWQVSAWPLLRGELRTHIQFAGPGSGGSVQLGLRPNGMRLENLRADLPAAYLADAFLDFPVIVEGRILADIPAVHVHHESGFTQAEGTLGWLGAASGLPQAIPLGDLRAELGTDDDGRLRAVARDHGGPLFLEATARLSPVGPWQIQGRLGARDQAEPGLGQALSLMGREDSEGRIPLNLSGRL
ncbi:type II secretion system protein N [Ectothiorhodospira marina]|uniref:type II secretion system protein N n=1 Tax=Ectothiorhodospira marina TaxID=1396821 RepID=UPI0015A6A328|nr:type II secretion system protein N [Ectothiorhodospira marina]